MDIHLTVGELIELLKQQPLNAEILLIESHNNINYCTHSVTLLHEPVYNTILIRGKHGENATLHNKKNS